MWYFLFIFQWNILSANSEDPDQASGLGLHGLSMSHKKVVRLIWVNIDYQLYSK